MNDAMERLASALVLNHLVASVGTEFTPDKQDTEIRQRIRHTIEKNRTSLLGKLCGGAKETRRRRVVAVVGAGASYSCHGAPLARDAAKQIRDELGFNDVGTREPDSKARKMDPSRAGRPSLKALYEIQIRMLTNAYRLNAEDFETQLLACSKLEPDGTQRLVREKFSQFYIPSLAYELLAHFFKHRFVDAIINFNFDELLDCAIDVEMSRREYRRVIFDGDCPSSRDTQTYEYSHTRPMLPLYIKPHGSVSHLSSLRFTRESYLTIPNAINDLIGSLVGEMPVTLWVIGFGMQSFEFNNVLKDNVCSDKSEIVFMDIKKPEADATDKPWGKKLGDGHFIDIGGDGLNGRMKDLWVLVDRFFRAQYEPRGITRHEVLHELFGDDYRDALRTGGRAMENSYLRLRMIIEIAIAIAKAQGFVDMKELSIGRPGRFFTVLDKRGEIRPGDSLYNLCRRTFGLKKVGYSRYTVSLEDVNEQWIGRRQYQNLRYIPIRCESEQIDVLADRLESALETSNIERSQLEHMRTLLHEMHSGRDVELSPKRALGFDIFEKPKAIATFTEMTYQTQNILNSDEWDVLFAVAETGEWLLEKSVAQAITKKHGRRIGLIVADPRFSETLVRRYQPYLTQDDVKLLPWWGHNNHMSVFLKRDKDGTKCWRSVFFVRRLRSSRIAPFVLGANDTRGILDTFVAYWRKAQSPGTLLRSDMMDTKKLLNTQFLSDRGWPNE